MKALRLSIVYLCLHPPWYHQGSNYIVIVLLLSTIYRDIRLLHTSHIFINRLHFRIFPMLENISQKVWLYNELDSSLSCSCKTLAQAATFNLPKRLTLQSVNPINKLALECIFFFKAVQSAELWWDLWSIF